MASSYLLRTRLLAYLGTVEMDYFLMACTEGIPFAASVQIGEYGAIVNVLLLRDFKPPRRG